MNRHQRMEAKRARRERRRSPKVARVQAGHPAEAEPGRARRERATRRRVRAEERRQLQRAELVGAGAAHMGEIVAPLVKAEQTAAKQRLADLEKRGLAPAQDPLVPIPCDCQPPTHGTHWIPKSRAVPEKGRSDGFLSKLRRAA